MSDNPEGNRREDAVGINARRQQGLLPTRDELLETLPADVLETSPDRLTRLRITIYLLENNKGIADTGGASCPSIDGASRLKQGIAKGVHL